MKTKTSNNKRLRDTAKDSESPTSAQKKQHLAPPSITTGPPPVQPSPHAKIDAIAATQVISPPPIDNDDLVPPNMIDQKQQQPQTVLASAIHKETSSAPASPQKTSFDSCCDSEIDVSEGSTTTTKSTNRVSWLYAILLFGIAGSAGFIHQSIVQDFELQIKKYKSDVEWSESQRSQLLEKHAVVKMQHEKVQLEREEMENQIKLAMEAHDAAISELEQVENQIREEMRLEREEMETQIKLAMEAHEAAVSELEQVENQVIEVSRMQLVTRFGEGPYKVEFQLQFPEENLDDLYSLTVDLEGESMPHSVLTFLSQVDEGLYNTGGFAFHHNAIHIVFGSPISNHLNKNELETWTSFETSGLSRLIFQEYSPEVPHVEYTIGFSERGPNIYFNTRDNTQNHGSIRDPCFGKVEKGREIIDRMHAASGELEEDDWKELQPGFVAVRSIAIL